MRKGLWNAASFGNALNRTNSPEDGISVAPACHIFSSKVSPP